MTMTTPVRAAGPAGFDAAAWLEEHAAGDLLMTPDGWMTEANRPARRILRLPPGREPRGLNFRVFCRQPARFTETVQAIKTAGFVGSWDADLVALDGGPVHAVVNLVGDFESGYLTAVRAQLFDIAEWRRGQERTLFGQRIEAIGRLAGGVAHDFNNLLTVISGHAECLSVGLAADSPMTRSVAAIQASASRAATLTEKLLSFGRRQVLRPRVVDPAEIVQQIEGTIRQVAGARLAITSDVSATAWRVRVDPARTERALFAVASHAVAAMADGGSLRFQLADLEIGPEWSPTRAFVKPGRFVRLDLACTRMTLDPDTHVRMFEPFFSERGVVRDGIDLAAAFGLVKQSGGYMWIDRDRTGEAVFSVLLPAIGEDVEPAQAAGHSRPTVLVVDEDEAVRHMVCRILTHQAYTVVEAESLDSARRLAEQTAVDLLIADLSSAAACEQLTAALRPATPRLRLLGITGSAGEDDGPPGTVLRKPFTAAEILDRVRGLLAD